MINPYIKLPIVLPGNEGEEEKEAEARIQPEQIQTYHPCYHWGSLIYMLGGGCVLMTKLTCQELDNIIGGYWAAIARKEKQEAGPRIATFQ